MILLIVDTLGSNVFLPDNKKKILPTTINVFFFLGKRNNIRHGLMGTLHLAF